MIYMVHVRHARAEPHLAAGGASSGELREGSKVNTRTVANLSDWPDEAGRWTGLDHRAQGARHPGIDGGCVGSFVFDWPVSLGPGSAG